MGSAGLDLPVSRHRANAIIEGGHAFGYRVYGMGASSGSGMTPMVGSYGLCRWWLERHDYRWRP